MPSFTKVKWNVNQSGIERMFKDYRSKVDGALMNIVHDYASIGAEYIRTQKILRGSPTGTKWHAYMNARRGNQFGARRETGAMYNSVGYEIKAVDVNSPVISASFGLPTQADDYFLKQEYGFMRTGFDGQQHYVRGMHSADAAYEKLKPYFRRQMLAAGFLKSNKTGRPDARGAKVLEFMGNGASFETAWRGTAPIKNAAQLDLWRSLHDASKIAAIEAYAKQVGYNINISPLDMGE